MKHILILLLSFSFFGVLASDDFYFDQKDISNEFQVLNSVEKIAENNKSLQLEDLILKNDDSIKGVEFNQSAYSQSNSFYDEMPLVSGFWWGCCLGIVGLALVYFITDNNKEEVKIAFWGCVISTLAWGIGGIWNPFGW